MEPLLPNAGRIVWLNGTSSAGKSSIAEQLLLALDTPSFHMSVDVFNGMRARERTLELDAGELEVVLTRTRSGFHHAVAGMAVAGNDLVVDYVFSEPWRLLECLRLCVGLDVVLVGVHCSEPELVRREAARGDREVGLALAQLEQVHSHGIYDIECDTTTCDSRECARFIKDRLSHISAPRAFDRLARMLLR